MFIDNNSVGITPLTVNDVAAGSHLLTLKLDGYQEYSTTTQVNAGATSTVAAALVTVTPTKKSPLLPVTILCALFIIALFVRRKY